MRLLCAGVEAKNGQYIGLPGAIIRGPRTVGCCGGVSLVLATNAPSYYLWCKRVRATIIRTRKQSERSLCLSIGYPPIDIPQLGQLTNSITEMREFTSLRAAPLPFTARQDRCCYRTSGESIVLGRISSVPGLIGWAFILYKRKECHDIDRLFSQTCRGLRFCGP